MSPLNQKHSHAQTQQISSKVFQPSKIVKKKSSNLRLQGIREAAMRKYETYLSEIRQMERTFQLEMKKTDQQSNRTLSRFADTIAALNSEMSQLINQSKMISKKLAVIRKRQEEASSTGLANCIAPMKGGFAEFGNEFNKACENIDSLFQNLSTRVRVVRKDYLAIKPFTRTVHSFEADIEKLSNLAKQNELNLFSAQEELTSLVADQRTLLVQKLNDKMKGLGVQIETLEKRAFEAFSQSQGVVADSQNSQYGMRLLFDRTMDQLKSAFKDDVSGLKRGISELNEHRFCQMNEIRARMAAMKQSLIKVRKERVKHTIADPDDRLRGRVSLQPEIDALKRKCDELEERLRQRNGKKNGTSTKKSVKTVKGMRCFTNIDEKGFAKVIFVDENGTVFSS